MKKNKNPNVSQETLKEIEDRFLKILQEFKSNFIKVLRKMPADVFELPESIDNTKPKKVVKKVEVIENMSEEDENKMVEELEAKIKKEMKL